MKSMIAIAAASAACIGLAGCSFSSVAPVAAASNVYTSYSDRIPGKWLLVVESGGMSTTVRPVGVACSAHNYPLDANTAFAESVRATVAQVVEDVEPIQGGAAAGDLQRADTAGVIRVRANTFQARLTFVPGFFSATAQAAVDMAASIEVDGRNGGRLLGTSVGANRSADVSGVDCPGGPRALTDATQVTMRDLMERLGERLANAPRVREAAVAAQQRAAPTNRRRAAAATQ